MKVLSLFSGIGAFEKALKNIGQPFELVGFSEIDKYAVKSYCAIHNVEESKNLGDITKIDENSLPKDIDLITYGFPCQDTSIAGKQQGLFKKDGTQTRSGLFFEALRIIEATKPKVAIAENVKNLVGKKFNAQFQVVLASLDAAGYNNYYKVLNAKDYGIPQNRERVFIVSIRKDIDTGTFKFPEGFLLEKRLKDLLEDVVDDSFYLSDDQVDKLHIKSTEGDSIKLMIKEHNRNARHQQDLLQHKEDICRCIPAGTHGSTPHLTKTVVSDCPLRIRKLTPKECFRLMGFSDEDFEKAAYYTVEEVENLNLRSSKKHKDLPLDGKIERVSNTQLYKQAGNSIVVDVIAHIFTYLKK